MEDLNAKVGSENSLLERFMEFCNFHRVVFGGKLLARSIGFWVTDNEHTSRKIDHIAINSRCRNSAVLTLASKGTIIWTERQFQIQYSRFHNPAVIQEENFFFLSIQPTRTFIFGTNELDATTLTAEMWKWIDKRKELRAPLMAPSGTEHDALPTRVPLPWKTTKRILLFRWSEKQELPHTTVHQITKEFADGCEPPNCPVRDVSGTLLSHNVEQLNRWNEHPKTTLNHISSGKVPPCVGSSFEQKWNYLWYQRA